MAQNTNNAEEGPRSFARFVEQVADGDAARELSEALHRVTRSMQEQSTLGIKVKGELSLKLKLSMDGSGVVDVTYDVSAKEPKPARAKGTFWLTKGGNLSPENPKQAKLPLAAVAQRTTDPFETQKEAK